MECVRIHLARLDLGEWLNQSGLTSLSALYEEVRVVRDLLDKQ